MREPHWRGGGRRAENGVESGGVELVQHVGEKRRIDVALVGFEPGPREFADTHEVDAERLHGGEIGGDGRFGPKFGVVGRAVVKRGRRDSHGYEKPAGGDRRVSEADDSADREGQIALGRSVSSARLPFA